jgi:hypothetical protein
LIKEKLAASREIEKECVFDLTSNESPLAVVLHKYELPKLVAADSTISLNQKSSCWSIRS